MSKASRDPQPLSKVAVVDSRAMADIMNNVTAELGASIGVFVSDYMAENPVTVGTIPAENVAQSSELRFISNVDFTAFSNKVESNDPRLSDARAPVTHGHSASDITGAVLTNDVRLSDARIPLTHSHFTLLTVSGDKPTGANTTPVTMGVSFDYAANSTYIIDLYLMVAPGAAGTGCSVLIDSSSAVTYIGTVGFHQLANTGTMSGFSSVGDAGATTKGVSSGMPGTNANFVAGSAILISGANAGTATFYFQSETTAVTTLKSGSVIRIMKV